MDYQINAWAPQPYKDLVRDNRKLKETMDDEGPDKVIKNILLINTKLITMFSAGKTDNPTNLRTVAQLIQRLHQRDARFPLPQGEDIQNILGNYHRIIQRVKATITE